MAILTFFLLILIYVSTAFNLSAQEWKWAKSMGDSSGATQINDICKYPGEQLLSAGRFTSSTLTLDTFTMTNAGRDDAFVALTNQDGEYLWTYSFGGSSEDKATAIAADQSGNIYVAGNFRSLSMTIDTTTLTNLGEYDGFLIKFNPDKTIAWAMSIGTEFIDEIKGIAIGSDGNVYLAGQTNDFTIFPAKRSVFVMKIDGNKNVDWFRVGASINAELSLMSMAIDNNNNCYLAGAFNGSINFGNQDTLNNAVLISSGFIVKYSSSGQYIKSIADTNFYKISALTFGDNHLHATGERWIYIDRWSQ